MITRIRRGFTRESDRDTYFEFLKKTALKDYAATPGNQGVWCLRRVRDGKAGFTLISLWDSYDAIKRFADDEYEKAHYYPEDKNYLLEFEPHVLHYEVLAKPDLT